jgi:hypothetical protein
MIRIGLDRIGLVPSLFFLVFRSHGSPRGKFYIRGFTPFRGRLQPFRGKNSPIPASIEAPPPVAPLPS